MKSRDNKTGRPLIPIKTSKMKSHKLLSSFIEYCLDNPNQRFWQALVNWSGYNKIFVLKEVIINERRVINYNEELEDVYYKERK